MKKNLVFASKKHQTLPFTIGGVTFWSKRLTGEEELLMSEVSDAVLSSDDKLKQQAGHLAELLTHRLQDHSIQINQDWAMKYLGISNTLQLVQFWRTGERPADFQHETFDLPEWGDPLLIGDGDDEHEFAARATSFSEQIALTAATSPAVHIEASSETEPSEEPLGSEASEVSEEPETSKEPSDAESLEAIKQIAVCVTDLLNARLKRGAALDERWLLQNLQIAEITELMTYLAYGKLPGEDEEAEANPNAEGAEPLSA
ncbi:hypothetical protein [Deinococcus sp. UYEF24]